jgi:hypothetical protein
LILYVGGTLGMVLDPVKKVLVPSSLKEQMGQMPELQHPTMPAYTVRLSYLWRSLWMLDI